MADVLSIPDDYQQKLIPMLSKSVVDEYRKSDFLPRFLESVEMNLSPLLAHSDAEQEFLELILGHGEIRPDLITSDSTLKEKIEMHPGLLWKAKNVRAFRRS